MDILRSTVGAKVFDENSNTMKKSDGSGGGGGNTISGQMFWNVGNVARKALFTLLAYGPIPEHVAFIMDGNRRYSKKWNLTAGGGHTAGFLAFMGMLKYCYELGVKYVSIYAFSIDNYRRKPEEVQLLMKLLQIKMEELVEVEGVVQQFGVRVYFCGNLDLLNPPLKEAVLRVMDETKHNTNTVLCVCVAYASTEEIAHSIHQCNVDRRNSSSSPDPDHHSSSLNLNLNGAVRLPNGCSTVATDGSIGGHHHDLGIRKEEIERNLYTAVAPDVDIIVRTSGETRLSNFMLWQSGGSLLYSPSALWPEIGLFHLVWSILNFQRHHPYLDKKKRQLATPPPPTYYLP